MTKIKEIIVVEGKSDTNRLKDCFGDDVDTIETTGSALNEKTIKQIKIAQKKRGVIIFTDPDFNGNRLRTIIQKAVPDAKQAFLPRSKAVPKHSDGSLGIEHARDEDIKAALKAVYTASSSDFQKYDHADMVNLGLVGEADSQQKRLFVGSELKIGYTNAKQFLNRLNMFQVAPKDLVAAVKNFDEGSTHDTK
ncbi:ribonuclease M5 [Companilactobacillus halodurans]|uniref:Ribonuclease M5 n=1 Tax=Companilactobacillus halodurans TaxID=2584183 RepID=A0A5P0ZZN3_9LACO|nr:ribonuclease M5 [Companilactobacillus halodurans]MQS76155.1 ribonuclease M5 [Companilactobacillus halodurans]MQS98238.1 ribonuclease M5 [Companilactobacillus halodurans]